MRKVYVVEFGGTPSRANRCLMMNCAAGLYPDMEFVIYPFDKDTDSPNFVVSRGFCEKYQKMAEVLKKSDIFSTTVFRKEDSFETLLRRAGIERDAETIRRMMSRDSGTLTDTDRQVLNICFTEQEQCKDLEGGYYGKANIGAVTCGYLKHKKVFEDTSVVADIKADIDKGNIVDVVIVCSSFGGTGASMGTNFGEYLAERYAGERDRVKIHCIHIQPYFSFPEPERQDQWQIRFNEFYSKSAAVIMAYESKVRFLKSAQEGPYVFDNFYFLGQEQLDQTAEVNSARGRQDNKLHIVDMLISMAVTDSVEEKADKKALYGYLYSGDGTEKVSWMNMPMRPDFQEKSISFLRFCAFVIRVLKPLLELKDEEYRTELLPIWIYGNSGGIFKKRANVIKEIDDSFRENVSACVDFCREYVKYWIEIEEMSKFGQGGKNATAFFNIEEVKKICGSEAKLEDSRESLQLDLLSAPEEGTNFHTGHSGLTVYDDLLCDSLLRGIGRKDQTGEEVARKLLLACYDIVKINLHENR